MGHALPVAEIRSSPALVALGAAIKRLRTVRGVAQEHLAFLGGVERSYMSSIERGMQNVGIMTLVKLAQALEISVAEIMLEAEL